MDWESIREHATKMEACFVIDTRSDNSKFWKLREPSPIWMVELVRMVHRDGDHFFPDDYRYKFIVESLNAIGEAFHNDENMDDEYEVEDFLPEEVYTSKLLTWLSSHNDRTHYIDEAEEFLPDSRTFEQALMCAYRLEQMEVLNSVVANLEKL